MFFRRKSGFTLTELLVVLCVALLVLALALRSMTNANETDRRVRCSRQLRALGQSLMMYANENKGAYPRTTYVVDAPPTQYSGWQAKDPFGPGGPSPNDVTACLFLLVRTQDITTEIFICPSTNLSPWKYPGNGSGQDFSNFPGNQHLAYSYANAYPNLNAARGGYRINSVIGAEFVVAADMNPGGGALSKLTPQSSLWQIRDGNSKNHDGAGQNVLYGDGHTEFQQTPFCGWQMDCIYTVASPNGPNSPTIAGSPQHRYDSVLLPVATIDPMGGGMGGAAVIYAVVGGIILLGLIGTILWLALRKKSPVSAAPPMPPR
jgi:prepilin-type N-terminal cleavage/methylation domain-containing protein